MTEVQLRTPKIKNHRPSVFTEDQFNHSDDDRKSFRSEAKPHKFNFEEKNEDYLEEQLPKLRGKSTYIAKPLVSSMVETSSMMIPSPLKQKINQPIKPRSVQLQPLASGGQPIKMHNNDIDYDWLYRQIKLTPMLEEKNQSEQTLQANEALGKTHIPSACNQMWSHVSDGTSQASQFALSDTATNKKQKQLQNSWRPVGKIKVFTPIMKVQEPPIETVEQGIQTTAVQMVQVMDKDFDDDSMKEFLAKEMQAPPSKQQSLKSSIIRKFDAEQEPFRQLNQLSYKTDEPGVILNQPENYDQPQKPSKGGDHTHTESGLGLNVTNFQQGAQAFDVGMYVQAYYALRSIQSNLRSNAIVKSIKAYLQLIASGRLDNIQSFRVPLHKKKTLKMALLYQRVSVIIVAFAYSVDKSNEAYKYLSNLIRYAINSYLVILKVVTNDQGHSQSKMSPQHKQVWALCNKQSLNKCFQLLKDNNQIILTTFFKLSRLDNLFFENLNKFLNNSSKFTLEQTFYFILEYLSFFVNLCDIEHKIPFLAVAPNPYLPPPTQKPYTLVVDVLQVMCLNKKQDGIHFRPYSQHFLEELSQYFEIVSFSAAFPNQMAKIFEALDKKKRIQHKLYLHHAIKANSHYTKDSSRLGRDLGKVLIVDTSLSQRSKANTIVVKPWSGGSKDTTLAQLCPILVTIAIKQLDARDAVSKYQQQSQANKKLGVKYLNYGMNF